MHLSGGGGCGDIITAQLHVYLTFMGPCIVNIFQYISNKMQLYTAYLYLETALHISGGTSTHYPECIQLYLQHLVFVTQLLLPAAGTSTHYQERIQLYLQHLVFVTPLLLPAAIAADSSNGVTNTRWCRYSCIRS